MGCANVYTRWIKFRNYNYKQCAERCDERIDSRDRRLKFMRQFECIADKRTYTESQLRQLFQFKVVHGYDNKFENWINEEIQNGYLRLLTDI